MSKTCLFIVLVMVMATQADPVPQFFNPFNTNGFVNPFVHQPFFHVPIPQPIVPNFGQIYSQFGNAKGNMPLNGGNVQFQSTNFGLGGGNFHGRKIITVIGSDGKPIHKVYENNNGVETEKEIVGTPETDLYGNGFSNSVIMSSGFEGGNFESTIFRSVSGPNGETYATVYKNKDGKEDVKNIKL